MFRRDPEMEFLASLVETRWDRLVARVRAVVVLGVLGLLSAAWLGLPLGVAWEVGSSAVSGLLEIGGWVRSVFVEIGFLVEGG